MAVGVVKIERFEEAMVEPAVDLGAGGCGATERPRQRRPIGVPDGELANGGCLAFR